MNKNINNFNHKYEYHGYQEWYFSSKNLSVRVNYINAKRIDYCEYHYTKNTIFYIK